VSLLHTMGPGGTTPRTRPGRTTSS
jgi:hypothetical protein